MGHTATVFAYPYGYREPLAEGILREAGFVSTVVTGNRISTVRRGDPESLFGLHRIKVDGHISSVELIEKIESLRNI